jgi:hypothetical protein
MGASVEFDAFDPFAEAVDPDVFNPVAFDDDDVVDTGCLLAFNAASNRAISACSRFSGLVLVSLFDA